MKKKLTKEYATEVYLNEEKALVIHQEDANGLDHFVIIHGKARISELVEALKELAKEVEA